MKETDKCQLTQADEEIISDSVRKFEESLRTYMYSMRNASNANQGVPPITLVEEEYLHMNERNRAIFSQAITRFIANTDESTIVETKKKIYRLKGIQLKNYGKYEKTFLTFLGKITYSRTCLIPADAQSRERLLALEGVARIFPLDQAMGIISFPFKVTPKMAVAIAKQGVIAKSYEKAAEGVYNDYNVSVSIHLVKEVTDYVGKVVFEAQQSEVAAARKASTKKKDKRKRRRRKNDILYLEVDGAMVHIRNPGGRDQWRESKHAIAFHSDHISYNGKEDSTGEPAHKLDKRDLIGFIGSAEEFIYYFYALALRNDSDRVSHIVVISDGANWIHSMVKELLPDAVHILDLFHAKGNASAFANAVKRGKKAKKAYADKLCKLIEEGKTQELLNELENYKDCVLPEGVVNMYTYVLNHQDCMHYPEYKALGYFVGSGAIESANKTTMQNRMKLQGMRWILEKARHMLVLKTYYESEKWNLVEDMILSL